MISVPQELWEFTLADSSFANCWLKQESCLAQLLAVKFIEHAAWQLRRWHIGVKVVSIPFHGIDLGALPRCAAKKGASTAKLYKWIARLAAAFFRCSGIKEKVDAHLVTFY